MLSVNPVVAECNDGFLNDIRARVVTPADIVLAIQAARSGPVQEGCVGAGTGVRCMGGREVSELLHDAYPHPLAASPLES